MTEKLKPDTLKSKNEIFGAKHHMYNIVLRDARAGGPSFPLVTPMLTILHMDMSVMVRMVAMVIMDRYGK